MRHSDFNVMELSVQFFEFQKFTNEEVAETMSHLRVSNVDHVIINVEVQLKTIIIRMFITNSLQLFL